MSIRDPQRPFIVCPCCGGIALTDHIYFMQTSIVLNGREIHMLPGDLVTLKALVTAARSPTQEGRIIPNSSIKGKDARRDGRIDRIRKALSHARSNLELKSVWGKGYILQEKKEDAKNNPAKHSQVIHS